MFRPKSLAGKSPALHPFALRIRDGHLVGLAPAPSKGAPCASCVENWLLDRNLKVSPIELGELPPMAKKVLKKLCDDNVPHTYYEVMDNGTQNRLDCLVFPHPRCRCKKVNYQPPVTIRKQTNLVLSPIFQIKCVRYGTPSGNLWYFTAMGQAPLTLKIVAAFGADTDKETARFKALNKWLKKASLLELKHRVEVGETFESKPLGATEPELLASNEDLDLDSKLVGIGNSEKEAVLDGLYSHTKTRIVEEFAQRGKNPMLVVGANNWLRQRLPFFLNQQFDLYLLFYPNDSGAWVVGTMALSRIDTTLKPRFSFGAHREIKKALDESLFGILEHCRPTDWKNRHKNPVNEKAKTLSQMSRWWNNWVYRCPKINLKDVLQLESHPNSLRTWKDQIKDRGGAMNIININSAAVPPQLKVLVKLNLAAEDKPHFMGRNVRGVGTWNSIKNHVDPV